MGCVDSTAFKKTRIGKKLLLHRTNISEGFLSHHLISQLMLTPFASATLIRKRQIIQHMYIKVFSRSDYHSLIMLEKVWIQSLFEEFVREAETEYFQGDCREGWKEIQARIADKILFEVYQLKEFFEASQARVEKVGVGRQGNRMPLSAIMLLADSTLYEIISHLQKKYKVAQGNRIIFPRLHNLRNQVNLLTRFPAKIGSDPSLDNINLLYRDLHYLLQRAVKQFPAFKQDMKVILGSTVQTDMKVKQKVIDGKKGFSATGFRRILVKWAETMLEIWPDMVSSIHFMAFIQRKNRIFDGFTLGGRARVSEEINAILVDLIASAQNNHITGKKNKQFGFYIYDLLRCKIHVKSSFEALDLLRQLKSVERTPSGRKVQVVRVKNRFDSHCRDILVNFLYGDVLVAEAQIAVTSGYNEMDSKRYYMKHYFYELDRSIFGPTIELMLEYEDKNKQDSIAKLYATGQVQKSGRKMPQYYIKPSTTLCPSKHNCLQLAGNMFNKSDQQFLCDCCLVQKSFNSKYFYCYKCSVMYCHECKEKNNSDFRHMAVNFAAGRPEKIENREKLVGLLKENKGIVVLATVEYSPASQLELDFVSYYIQSKKPTIKIYQLELTNNTKQLLQELKIDRYPTLLLLSPTLIPIKSITGIDIFKLPQFLSFCSHFLSQTPYKQNCPSSHPMQVFIPDFTYDWQCCQCSASNITLYTFLCCKDQIAVCKPCKYTLCNNCGFMGMTDNQGYYDRYGMSYLSTRVLEQQMAMNCLGDATHEMKVTHENPTEKTSYRCRKCNIDWLFISQHGMAYCKQCEIYVCPTCLGTKKPLQKHLRQIQYANHFAQITASDGTNCQTCMKPYKKAYSTRKLSKHWYCKLCSNPFPNQTLHLSCFDCDEHICVGCVNTYHLLEKKAEGKFEEFFRCEKGHEVKYFDGPESTSEQQATFTCTHCKATYYVNSQRYVCRQCEVTSCRECLLECFRYCEEDAKCEVGHILKPDRELTTNFYCKVCLGYYSPDEDVLRCGKCRDYKVCQGCSRKMQGKPQVQQIGKPKCECGRTLKIVRKMNGHLSICSICEDLLKQQTFQSCRFCQKCMCLQCVA